MLVDILFFKLALVTFGFLDKVWRELDMCRFCCGYVKVCISLNSMLTSECVIDILNDGLICRLKGIWVLRINVAMLWLGYILWWMKLIYAVSLHFYGMLVCWLLYC